jgi:hypothetical protein
MMAKQERDTVGDPIRGEASRSGMAGLCVWAVLVLLFLAALIFVRKYGRNIPMCDEWSEMVPAMAGEQPITLAWLWQQYAFGDNPSEIGEHRLPLPKIVFMALYSAAGNDLRGIMYYHVIASAILAGALILTARSIRGWNSFTDAIFPILLLHWGHAPNWLSAFQVQFILSTSLVLLILILIVKNAPTWDIGSALLVAVGLMLLTLCGGNGLIFVLPMALWLGWYSYHCFWRMGSGGGMKVLGVWLMLSIALLLTAAYFIGFRPGGGPPSPGIGATLRIALQFLTMSFGTGAGEFWPYSGVVVGFVLLGVLGFNIAALFSRPKERGRATGLLCFMAVFGMLALAVGVGRAGADPERYALGSSRYILVGCPLLCCGYFVLDLYPPRAVRGLGQLILFSLVCCALSQNAYDGRKIATWWKGMMDDLRSDLRAGVPALKLAQRYAESSLIRKTEAMTLSRFRMLKAAGLEPFAQMKEGPPVTEYPMPVIPSGVYEMTWQGQTGHGSGSDPQVMFALPEAKFVCGLRIRCSYPPREGPTGGDDPRFSMLHIFWSDCGAGKTGEYQRLLQRGGQEHCVTVWIYERIKSFRIQPDEQPCDFRITGIELLVPRDEDHVRFAAPEEKCWGLRFSSGRG